MTNLISESGAGPSGCGPPPFNVSVRSDGPAAYVIDVQGELDLSTGPMLKQHMDQATSHASRNGGRPRAVVYQLPELEFMDARGLHYLLTAVDGHAETITIREPSSRVRRLLELVGLDSMIEERANL